MNPQDELLQVLWKLYKTKAIAPPPCEYLSDVSEQAGIEPERDKEIAVRLNERGLVSYIEVREDVLIGLTAKGVESVLEGSVST